MKYTVKCLTTTSWCKDKREVALLSTFHDDSMIDKRRRTRATEGGIETISKPKAIDDYMGGVDLSDQLLQYYGYCHR